MCGGESNKTRYQDGKFREKQGERFSDENQVGVAINREDLKVV